MKDKTWLFIVNPVASGVRLKLAWKKIEQDLRKLGLQFEVVFTEKRGHASILAKEGVDQGHRYFVGVGGDGTNNEIINGLLTQNTVAASELYYTLFPFGTGNDWSRTHKIPRNPEAWYYMLIKGRVIKHSVAKVDIEHNENMLKRYFINIAGFAYDAHIVKISESYSNKNRRKLLYLWLVFKCLFNFSSPLLKIRFDDQERKGKYYNVNCGVCNYSGGGMKLLPQADPTGGFLAITLIKDFSKWLVPFASPNLFSGRVASFKYAEVTKCQTIKIEAEKNNSLEIEVDGEYLGTGTATITIIPNAIKVIVP